VLLGLVATRTVSVLRVLVASPSRFVAWCDNAKVLRWFRLDSIPRLTLAPEVAYVDVADGEVDRFVDTSVDGYRGEPIKVAFYVGAADARWVMGNLLSGELNVTREGDGILVEAETGVPRSR
jgi:hypothetical protein